MESSAAKTDSDNNSQDVSSDEEGIKNIGDGKTSGKKRSLPASEEEKKAERRAANRRSAFQSRQRRKILIEDLQRTVAGLSKENTDLRKSNEDLRVQLKAILLENHQLRMQQQMHNPNVGATDLMQASALLRGGGQNSAIAQLLGAGGVAGQLGGQAQPPVAADASSGNAPTSAPNGDNDSLLNSRLALVAAQARADELGQSQDGATATAPPAPSNAPQASAPQSSNGNAPMSGMDQNQAFNGLQSLFDSARQGGFQGSIGGNHQLNVLQGLLENSAFGGGGGGGAPGGAMGGLAALYDSISRNPGMGGGGLNDIQRALLACGGGNNAAGIAGLTAPKPANNGNDNTVSDALRNLLQKNQPS
ncbi:unnamed protein product [Cylindrotheca closterium]|uniref:BZIP domain-containing protein n=1 Tax=Cylindrotheca closterium TaxID=2856 RepID=A0AAD2FYQ0_9STRA|nr:unnamed protein product [Cylindrotheca closterium]